MGFMLSNIASNPNVQPFHSFLLVVTELISRHGIQHIATLLLAATCIVGVGARNVSNRAEVL